MLSSEWIERGEEITLIIIVGTVDLFPRCVNARLQENLLPELLDILVL